MKIQQKSFTFLAIVTCVMVNFSLPVAADSTADLILNLDCQGDYKINIWKTKKSGELLYRSISPQGKLSLKKGTSQVKEGVRVYQFRNGNYQYWAWDGTLDSQEAGMLEVYKNNQLQLQQACTKS
ncbi:hypothetical protein [Fortiea contorta]|uniref:hypothetical protein n=1 Tax=Fortiea contorta TaxID=1892405 RepID=UPI00034B4522|nr:hypothetical protein [Fortiea contorta]